MAGAYQILEKERLTHITIDEQVAANELDEIITAIISDASYLPGNRTIIDTRQAQTVPRSGEVLKIAELFAKYKNVFCSKTAIIVKGALYREIMDLTLVLIKAKTRIRIEQFNSVEAAMEWFDNCQADPR